MYFTHNTYYFCILFNVFFVICSYAQSTKEPNKQKKCRPKFSSYFKFFNLFRLADAKIGLTKIL